MSKDSGNGLVGFFSGLQILFITLKLTKFVSWPWWVVMSPSMGMLSGIITIAVLIVYLQSKNDEIKDAETRRRNGE